jgi:hypothetical protein
MNAGDPSARDGRGASRGRLLFRFGVGFLELTAEGLAGALETWHDLAHPEPETPAAELEPPTAGRHVVIGALASTPRALAAVAARAGRRGRPAAALAGRALRRLSRAPGAGAVARRWRALRGRAGAQLARWGRAGRREEDEGRTLARLVVAALFEGAVARVADSPDLKRVIEEQSQGLAVTAVAELRERSARADSVAEAVTRRFVRRPRAGGVR